MLCGFILIFGIPENEVDNFVVFQNCVSHANTSTKTTPGAPAPPVAAEALPELLEEPPPPPP
jgi:hypothetical protein